MPPPLTPSPSFPVTHPLTIHTHSDTQTAPPTRHPAGYTTTPSGCVERNACLTAPPQPGSATPCFPGVRCTRLARADPATGKEYRCGLCPVGFAGDGTACFACPLYASVPFASFAGATVLRSQVRPRAHLLPSLPFPCPFRSPQPAPI